MRKELKNIIIGTVVNSEHLTCLVKLHKNASCLQTGFRPLIVFNGMQMRLRYSILGQNNPCNLRVCRDVAYYVYADRNPVSPLECI